jgi:hypothetical protein
MKPLEQLKGVVLETSTEVSDRLRKRAALTGYVKREREPGEAPGQLISKLSGTYVPEKTHVRPGADDHLKIKSKGIG